MSKDESIQIIFSEKTEHHLIEVIQSKIFGKTLTLDGAILLTEQSHSALPEMMVHVPSFLLPAPKAALIVGGGTGREAAELLNHAAFEKIIILNDDELVSRTSKEYFPEFGMCLASPRVKLFHGDPNLWIQENKNTIKDQFDLILISQTVSAMPSMNTLKKMMGDHSILIGHAGNPHFELEGQLEHAHQMKTHFNRVHFYNFTNLTEPGGLQTLSFCTDSIHPIDDLKRDRVVSSGLKLDYYNLGIHEAAFFLPEFQKRKLDAVLNPL